MGQGSDFVSVSTPVELVEAVKNGVPHIIVKADLDMSAIDPSEVDADESDYALSIAQVAGGGYTRSIRVRSACVTKKA